MAMKLVCDHCNNVIEEAEFREVKICVMTRSLIDPASGTARTSDDISHYHTACLELREGIIAQVSADVVPLPKTKAK